MQQTSFTGLWAGLKSQLLNIRHHGAKGVAELLAFSLFFMLGLVTLGTCLLAGAAAALYARWQAGKTGSPARQQDDAPVADTQSQAQAQTQTIVIA
ncbi:hypothetical protein [Shewanella sp. GXUN23E]|uniref:hypothetical protein n=1 Tax=Shewanella sp. GXUN23E TaxID=3422498 RepID=UPI003D7E477A